MSRRAITQELYAKLLGAFRSAPGNGAHAGRIAGCDHRTAHRAYHDGWPNAHLAWARPIKDVLEEEQSHARGRLAELEAEAQAKIDGIEAGRGDILAAAEDQARITLEQVQKQCEAKLKEAEEQARRRLVDLHAKARLDQAESRAERAQMVRAARKNAASLLGFIMVLYQDFRTIADEIRKHVGDMEPAQLIAYAKAVSKLTKDATEAAQIALAMEDRELGKPDLTIQVEHLSLEEAAQEIDEAKALVDLARERGMLVGLSVEPEPPGSNGTSGTNGSSGSIH